MKIFGLEISRAQPEEKQAPFESALMRLVASQYGMGYYGAGLYEFLGQYVTPETCMRSPTVQAIVTSVARRISVSPVQVFRRVETVVDTDKGEQGLNAPRERRERVRNHPVEKLLDWPNDWQTSVNYWQDATSRLLRYGNFYAYKSRGSTGPIRELLPLHPQQMQIEQNLNTYGLTYLYNGSEVAPGKLHHIRGPSRNGLVGDSPILDVVVSIGLEIAAESFGATFFNNGALPFMIFRYAQGMQAFKNAEDEKSFINDVQNAFGGERRHRAMLLPKGLEMQDPVKVENDKAQFLETRKYQRTVIAGAFGVPPHLVGDLERATFNNVEQQDSDFVINVVMPWAHTMECAMERDLLTDADRNGGIIIRFNLDAVQRADFKSRQEGLLIQRNAGVICPNDWRAAENMNPIPEEDGGEDYIRPLNYVVAGDEAAASTPPTGAGAESEPAAAPVRKPNGAAKEFITHMLSEMREVRELVENVESRRAPIEVIVNMPEIPPAVVNIAPAQVKVEPAQVHITPAPITVEGTTVNVAPPQVIVEGAAAKPALDKVIERGKDGRLVAIRSLPAKVK